MKNRPVTIACLIGLLALVNPGRLPAQTNTNAAVTVATNVVVEIPPLAATNTLEAVSPPKPRAPTLISADHGEFDLANRVVTYRGHVRVDDPELKLASEWLTTDLPRPGEHVSRIVAETNVVIDFMDDRGKTNHATCARTVYSYLVENGATNESVTLSGHAKVENADFVMTGEPIVLNLATRKITADSPVVTPRQSLINPSAGTNSAPATKAPINANNSPPATKPATDMTNPPSATHSPGADTNFPPGKLDLIPGRRAVPRRYDR